MTTIERGPKTASFLDPPRPQRLRRLAALRVLLRPCAAAMLLAALADESAMHERMLHAALRAHVAACIPGPLRRG